MSELPTSSYRSRSKRNFTAYTAPIIAVYTLLKRNREHRILRVSPFFSTKVINQLMYPFEKNYHSFVRLCMHSSYSTRTPISLSLPSQNRSFASFLAGLFFFQFNYLFFVKKNVYTVFVYSSNT